MTSVETRSCNDGDTELERGARSRLARALRLLRVARGWSQEELANASGLHRTSISLIERAACSISLDNLERLANTFSVRLSELLGAVDPAAVEKPLPASLREAMKKKGGRPAC